MKRLCADGNTREDQEDEIINIGPLLFSGGSAILELAIMRSLHSLHLTNALPVFKRGEADD